ncbi:hypothetical protein ACFS2C_15415 [Prauserella oleivorans]|uniref:DUF222 domain-containing protein n=1 Tax=Prauserella oleivorans TaxID=1478153 RepID=A0ABW5WCJ4_9PSEU
MTGAEVPLSQWGRRLSDTIRDKLAEGDTAAALRLIEYGDGQTKSLAKEYALMYRGLGFTVRVILDALRMDENDTSGAGAAELVHQFRGRFTEAMHQAWADAPPVPGPVGSPADEARECRDLLEWGERRFDREQRELAEQVSRSVHSGQLARARDLLDRKERGQFVPLHDRLVRMMAESFAFVFGEQGADGLLRFHTEVAHAQRAGFDRWEAMPTRDFAHAFTFLLKQHMGTVEVREEPDRFVLDQQLCGSGGRLIQDGAYTGPTPLPSVPGNRVLGAGRDVLPVYCSHCPAWNTHAPRQWYGHPHVRFADPARPDGSCTLHIMKRER